jgi:hypothetical protein
MGNSDQFHGQVILGIENGFPLQHSIRNRPYFSNKQETHNRFKRNISENRLRRVSVNLNLEAMANFDPSHTFE